MDRAMNASLATRAKSDPQQLRVSLVHILEAVVVCSAACSNTSCSITEVLDLSPHSPPSHNRVCVCVSLCGRTGSGHRMCTCVCELYQGMTKSQRARVCFP